MKIARVMMTAIEYLTTVATKILMIVATKIQILMMEAMQMLELQKIVMMEAMQMFDLRKMTTIPLPMKASWAPRLVCEVQPLTKVHLPKKGMLMVTDGWEAKGE